MDEIWIPVERFPDYEVSNLGRVRSNNDSGKAPENEDRTLKPWKHKFGYPMVSLYRDGKVFKRTVHSLVCRAFHGPPPTALHEVAHDDGKPENVRWDNLRWALPVENAADKRRHGTHFNSGQFKPELTEGEVREIRRLLAEGKLSQSAIAAKFNIWQTMVSHIKLRRRWGHFE